MRSEIVGAIIGGVIGVSVVSYMFVYVPMAANYAECGKLTVCQPWPSK